MPKPKGWKAPSPLRKIVKKITQEFDIRGKKEQRIVAHELECSHVVPTDHPYRLEAKWTRRYCPECGKAPAPAAAPA